MERPLPGNGHGGCGGRSGETGWSQGQHRAPDRPYYCNVYVPQLQHAGGLLGYVQRQLGLPVASTAPLAKITDRFAQEMHRFAAVHGVPWVDFVKGQRKDDVMHEHLAEFTAVEGVVFIGRAQEKTKLL